MQVSDVFLNDLNAKAEVFVDKYKESPVEALMREYNLEMKAKNYLNLLTNKLVEHSGILAEELELDYQSVKLKTIKLDRYGRLKESMSFPTFKYKELVMQEWETSDLRKMFTQTVFLFVIYQQRGKETYLQRIVVWKMPEEALETDVKKAWEKTKECIEQGRIVKYIDQNDRYFTFFPASTENPYVHVRPHARNRDDVYELPVADELTGLTAYPKHCFWLNRNYISRIIKKSR